MNSNGSVATWAYCDVLCFLCFIHPKGNGRNLSWKWQNSRLLPLPPPPLAGSASPRGKSEAVKQNDKAEDGSRTLLLLRFSSQQSSGQFQIFPRGRALRHSSKSVPWSDTSCCLLALLSILFLSHQCTWHNSKYQQMHAAVPASFKIVACHLPTSQELTNKFSGTLGIYTAFRLGLPVTHKSQAMHEALCNANELSFENLCLSWDLMKTRGWSISSQKNDRIFYCKFFQSLNLHSGIAVLPQQLAQLLVSSSFKLPAWSGHTCSSFSSEHYIQAQNPLHETVLMWMWIQLRDLATKRPKSQTLIQEKNWFYCAYALPDSWRFESRGTHDSCQGCLHSWRGLSFLFCTHTKKHYWISRLHSRSL